MEKPAATPTEKPASDSHRMKRPLLAASLIAVSALCIVLFYPTRPAENRTPPPPAPIANSRVPGSRAPQDFALRDKMHDRLIRSEWSDLLAWLDGTPPPSADQIRTRLRNLRSDWAQLDPHVLATTLKSLLDSGANRSTGLPFTVGPQGFLSDWPDLRTFLVDSLAIADPDESAKIARALLRETDSSSEFAVAIRSLIRGNETSAPAPELLACFHTLLSRPEWQNDPALAESLDLARYLGNQDAATALLDWKGNPQARNMALHEFAADHPDVMISTLSQKTDSSSPESAALLARADPASPAQAAAVDAFLRNPAIPLEHRKSFLTLYPLRSLTTGYRLYRGNPTPYDEDSILRSDHAALAQAESWLKDPALALLKNELTTWKNQLIEWQKSSQ